MLEIDKKYTVVDFGIGTDHWLMLLNDPFPHSLIREAFPGRDVELIGYGRDQRHGKQAMRPGVACRRHQCPYCHAMDVHQDGDTLVRYFGKEWQAYLAGAVLRVQTHPGSRIGELPNE